MSDPRDMPRVTINWTQFRPHRLARLVDGGRVSSQLRSRCCALIAIIASTLLVVALIVGSVAAAAWFIGNLFRRQEGATLVRTEAIGIDA